MNLVSNSAAGTAVPTALSDTLAGLGGGLSINYFPILVKSSM